MNITAIRIGKTFNTGNYTSKKVEIEAIPDNGQSFDDAMAQVNAIVDAQNPDSQGATTAPKPKPATKPANSAPPLAKGAKSGKADPTQSATAATQTSSSQAEPPFEPGRDVAAEPKPKKKRGRPRKAAKVPDHEKELNYALEAESLDELFERFNNLRTFADAFGSLENWAGACAQVQQRYKQLNMATSDPDLVDSIVAALRSESTAIAEKRQDAA